MTTYIDIICLANSRKRNGHCIAGKMFDGNHLGGWMRPVSALPTGELSSEDISFENGKHPRLLDVITVPVLNRSVHHYQAENYQIDTNWYWEKKGRIGTKNLDRLRDDPPELWYNGDRSFYGCNDRVPEDLAKTGITSSLFFIKLQSVSFTVGMEYDRRKVRAEFTYRKELYRLIVTDLDFEKKLLQHDDGVYTFPGSAWYVTISLGELFQGYCYKLVAAVIQI
jgi:hypothetical protein